MVRAAIALLVLAGCHATAVAPVAAPAAHQRESAIAGVVRDGKTGRPLSGVTVSASKDGLVTPEVVTDSTGRFRFAGVLPGHYVVHARRAHASAERAGVRLAGSASTHVVVYLDAPPEMEIRVQQRRVRVLTGSDVDRARCCVDQSPRQLRYDGRPRGPRPPR